MGTPSVLVVDDTPANIRLLEALLGHWGYEVVAAGSGLEALALLKRRPIDLVLLDLRMPEMDGHEVCRRIRADPDTRALPVIMITADGEADRVTALEASADDFVVKPFDHAELRARVRSLMRIKTYYDTIVAQAGRLEEWNIRLEARVREQVEDIQRLARLRRFLSPQVAEAIMSSEEEVFLESHRREIAVFFTELRGLTPNAAAVEPEEVLEVLRDYHATVGALIRQFQATVGSISGAAVMAYFNDPLPCPAPATAAVRMGLALRSRMAEVTESWQKRGHEVSYAVGVALGYATLGTIGFEGRYEYAPVGPVVHLGAQLAEQAAPGQILVDPRAYAATESLIEAEGLPPLQIRGSPRAVPVFNVLASKATDEAEQVGKAASRGAELGLTERELEVLMHLAEGRTNRQIAAALFISEKTASVHVSHILTKLGVENRAEATAAAYRLGLADAST